jgi:hypothetical protein
MLTKCLKYDKQDKQGKAAFNERNPHMIQQHEPVARSPGGPLTKSGQFKTYLSGFLNLPQPFIYLYLLILFV